MTDQPIPKGLHVRINLQTGERQAKLLSKENMKEIPAKKTSVSLFSKNNFDYKKSSYLQEAVKKIINETNDDETNVIIDFFDILTKKYGVYFT